MIFLSKGVIFRFHVNFLGSTNGGSRDFVEEFLEAIETNLLLVTN